MDLFANDYSGMHGQQNIKLDIWNFVSSPNFLVAAENCKKQSLLSVKYIMYIGILGDLVYKVTQNLG